MLGPKIPGFADTPEGPKMREECSMSRTRRRNATPEFRAEAVRLCKGTHDAVRDIVYVPQRHDQELTKWSSRRARAIDIAPRILR